MNSLPLTNDLVKEIYLDPLQVFHTLLNAEEGEELGFHQWFGERDLGLYWDLWVY